MIDNDGRGCSLLHKGFFPSLWETAIGKILNLLVCELSCNTTTNSS